MLCIKTRIDFNSLYPHFASRFIAPAPRRLEHSVRSNLNSETGLSPTESSNRFSSVRESQKGASKTNSYRLCLESSRASSWNSVWAGMLLK